MPKMATEHITDGVMHGQILFPFESWMSDRHEYYFLMNNRYHCQKDVSRRFFCANKDLKKTKHELQSYFLFELATPKPPPNV